MLEISYEITRDEKDETKTYTVEDPAIQKMNGPIVCFQAPNGMGKSTLLNIISMALYGGREDPTAHQISPVLQNKIKWLSNRKDQVLSFELIFTSPDGRTQLISRKGIEDKDISVEEIIDGKSSPLPFPTFKTKYFLIYEIPHNPVEKLKDITEEVLTKQNDYLLKVKNFRAYLSDTQTEIGKARNEKHIATVKEENNALTFDLKELDESIISNKEKRSSFENYYNLREYGNYAKSVIDLNEKIKVLKLTGATKKVKTQQKNIKLNNEKLAVESGINNIIKNITQIKNKLSPIIFDDIERISSKLSPILNLNINQILENHTVDTNNITVVLNYFEQRIAELQEERDFNNPVMENNFYNEIIDILENYKFKNVSIPGTNSTLTDLISKLHNEIEKNHGSVKISESLKESQDLITITLTLLPPLKKNLESLKLVASNPATSDEVDEGNSQKDEVEQSLVDIKLKKINRDKYLKFLTESGIDKLEYDDNFKIKLALRKIEADNPVYKTTFQQDEREFGEIILKLTREIENQMENRESMNQILDRKKNLLIELEAAKPHKYQAYGDLINHLRSLADNLDGKLIDFNNTIKKIKSEGALKDDEEIQYNDCISEYLAKRIPKFPYNGEYYEPVKIDLSKKIIYTTTGKQINTADISTGQGMSMYIRSLLSSDADNQRDRKYIVIFDEAHTMDRVSFAPIKEELIKMNNNNRLMFAMFVKPNSDTIKVVDLM